MCASLPYSSVALIAHGKPSGISINTPVVNSETFHLVYTRPNVFNGFAKFSLDWPYAQLLRGNSHDPNREGALLVAWARPLLFLSSAQIDTALRQQLYKLERE